MQITFVHRNANKFCLVEIQIDFCLIEKHCVPAALQDINQFSNY